MTTWPVASGNGVGPRGDHDHGTGSDARARLLSRLLRGERPGDRTTDRTIPHRPPDVPVPLTFQQDRLWFLDQLVPGSTVASIQVAVRLGIAADPVILHRCLNELVARHEMLRTCLRQVDGRPVQVVAPQLRLPLTVIDLTGLPPDRADAAVLTAAAEQGRRPFDLTTAPLLRCLLLRLDPAESVLAVTIHHAIADGWSLRLFFAELATRYPEVAAGRPDTRSRLPIQYGDFAVWQRDQLSGPRLRASLDHWTTALDQLPVLDLPTDHPRPPVQTFAGAAVSFTVPVMIMDRVRELAVAAGATPFMALLTCFAALLHRYSGQEDLVIGSYSAGRTRVELESLIGFFVNTLVLRVDLSGDPGFTEALGRVRDVCLSAFTHEDVPFEKLVEALAPVRDLSRNPLCQVAFQLVTGPAGTEAAADSGLEVDRGTANFDLVCSIRQFPDGSAGGSLEYLTDLFEPATIEQFATLFTELIGQAVGHPDRPLSQLPLPGPDPAMITGPEADHPATPPAVTFEELVAARPDAPALIMADGSRCSYRELHDRVIMIDTALRAPGAGPGRTVGVLLDRSPDWWAAAIAVARVGARYLPLDPALPDQRLRFMIDDSAAAIMITDAAGRLATDHEAPWTTLDLTDLEPSPGPPAPPAPFAADQAAWLLYTSGSTGTPKGVAAPLRPLLNRLHWFWRTLPWADGEVLAARTPIGFVDSLWELWGGLLQGVPTLIVPPAIQADPDELIMLLRRQRATRVWLVPSLLRAILATHPELGRETPDLSWYVSGEPLPYELARRFFAGAPAAELYNLYGTTEIWDATWHRCRPADRNVPIGRPIDGTTCFVVDRHGAQTPIGIPGELVVAGAGLADGYLDRPELTGQRFGPRPDGAPGLAYRTGDRVRWAEPGRLEFCARLDDQVKVRGVRVELGEVETALAGLPGVVDAAVAAHADPAGFTALTAYLVPAQDAGPEPATIEQVRRLLAEQLPGPALPTRLLLLDALPRTASGKLDRRALPPPDPVQGGSRTEPDGPVEAVVQAVWADILGGGLPGIEDNFFSLGGHSLLATQIVSRLRTVLAADLPLRTFFETPTIAGLAQTLGADPRVYRAAELAVRLLSLTDAEVAAELARSGDHEPDPDQETP
ncbi:amino acid adenylation domain-containing protein [Microlunatus sp. GCM10028923]|uniref:amino acid adenylation domain-containing protein n=1 Tax=Microlunatus sp. GCM10028923 TaxID=3273400 RepID=UPI00361D703C